MVVGLLNQFRNVRISRPRRAAGGPRNERSLPIGPETPASNREALPVPIESGPILRLVDIQSPHSIRRLYRVFTASDAENKPDNRRKRFSEIRISRPRRAAGGPRNERSLPIG